MSITDELRKCMKGSTLSSWTVEHLTAIADRIDAEHEKACDDAWNNGYEADYLGIEKWLTEHPQAMELHGWVRLPKDADGEYIHMGDRMENGEMVARIVLTDGSWEPTIHTAATPNQLHEYYCHDIRHHHHPDTWERIIEDALDGYHDTDFDALVARCRALASEPTP